MTEPTREQLLEEGRKQARIQGVDQACAQVYAEGWAAAMARATRAIEEAQRAADRSLWDASFNADLAAKGRIAMLERQLRCVQLYGYGYLLKHGGEQIALDPKDVTVVLPASRHIDDFDLHNSLHLAEEKLAVLERRIARVRQMCDLMLRVKDAQAILEVLDGIEDEKPPAVGSKVPAEPVARRFDPGLARRLDWNRPPYDEHTGMVTVVLADMRADVGDFSSMLGEVIDIHGPRPDSTARLLSAVVHADGRFGMTLDCDGETARYLDEMYRSGGYEFSFTAGKGLTLKPIPVHPSVEPGERCNHLYAYTAIDIPAQVTLQCGLRRHGNFGPHVGSYQGTPVTWTMADHREDRADA